MPSPRKRNATNTRPSLREKTRNKFRKIRSENRAPVVYLACRGLRETARQTLSSVKTAVENISNRLGAAPSYAPVGTTTPVKLYTPFGIETPSPAKDVTPPGKSPRKFPVGTPVRKLREDLREISTGTAALSAVARRIAEGRRSLRTDPGRRPRDISP